MESYLVLEYVTTFLTSLRIKLIIFIDPYPTVDRYFTYNDTVQPWLGPDYTATGDELQLNVMMEGLSIDPFNSDHWLYGTGGGIQGGFDLTKWDTVHNMTLEVLTVGIEETVINDLIVPPGGALLISAVGDSGGQCCNVLIYPSEIAEETKIHFRLCSH
jgi:xyloglucan-specific exo-beta-1,4-glucanase